eukprot:scaffold49961_cov44-Attheya_sp.AAC.7
MDHRKNVEFSRRRIAPYLVLSYEAVHNVPIDAACQGVKKAKNDQSIDITGFSCSAASVRIFPLRSVRGRNRSSVL